MSRGFNQLLDAVVRIDVREVAYESGARRIASSIGSGVILSADGLVLTNAHVASPRAVELNITLANLERVGATLVGWDHWTDLALLRIDVADAKRRGLKFATAEFGDSDKLYPGQTVFAVGTPHGLTRTVTRGIISNNNRYFEDSNGVGGYETGPSTLGCRRMPRSTPVIRAGRSRAKTAASSASAPAVTSAPITSVSRSRPTSPRKSSQAS